MKKNRSDLAANDAELNFDFDEWVELYRQSPEQFEQRRLQWCHQVIDSAPQAYQRRLSGILFQINMEKRRSRNPIQHCMRISQMMWDKFDELNSGLQTLCKDPVNALLSPEQQQYGQKIQGQVLAFTDDPANSKKGS